MIKIQMFAPDDRLREYPKQGKQTVHEAEEHEASAAPLWRSSPPTVTPAFQRVVEDLYDEAFAKSSKRDRTAYMRAYMAKKRAAARDKAIKETTG